MKTFPTTTFFKNTIRAFKRRGTNHALVNITITIRTFQSDILHLSDL